MFEVITIKTDGLGVTSDDVNRLKLSLDRQRSLYNDGMTIARLSCYTDDPTGLRRHPSHPTNERPRNHS